MSKLPAPEDHSSPGDLIQPSGRTLSRILGVSFPATSPALDELQRAGVLDTRTVDRGATAYTAGELLDLTSTEGELRK
jgi:DNA-binding transcriptional regulator YhcF (GntR family)